MLEKARQAERLTAERDAAQERYERYRTAVIVRDEITELDADAPVAHAAPRAPARRSSGCARVDAKIATLQAHARGRGPGQLRGAARGPLAPALALGAGPRRGRRSRSRSSASCSTSLGVVDLGVVPLVRRRRRSPAIGLALAIVGLVAAARRTASRRSSATSRSTGGCAAARRSSRSCARRPGGARRPPRARSASRRATEAEARLGRGGAHVAEIDQRRARLSGLIGDEPLEAAARRAGTPPPSRSSRRPRRSRRSGRSPRSPARASGSRSRSPTPSGSWTGRATTRPTPAPAWSRTRSTPRRSRASPSGSPAGQEELAALRRRERIYARTLRGDQRGRAGDDEARDALPRAAHGPGRRPRSPAAATGASGSTTRNLGIEVYSPERNDWVPVTRAVAGHARRRCTSPRGSGLVRLVTGDRRPPLILDDPFVTLDDARAPARAGAAREVSPRTSR